MRVLLYSEFDRLEMSDVDVIEPAPDEVQLAVGACGICGSELEAFKTRSPRRIPPLVLGHEFCGTIVGVGREVSGWSEGARVVSHSLVHCGVCVRCRRGDTHLCGDRQIFGMKRPGGFAQFVNVPARCLIPWPDGVPAEVAAMAEPAANGVHVVGMARHLAVERAVVIGAGPIGLFCQQMLQVLRGAEVIVADLSAERRAVAARLGARRTVDPRAEDLVQIVKDWTGGEGADLVVDAAGAAVTKRQSLAATRAGGGVVWIGLHEREITFDSFEITLPERTVFGTYAATMAELSQALDLLASGRVDGASWTTTFSLEEGVTAFERALAAKGNDIKAVLVP